MNFFKWLFTDSKKALRQKSVDEKIAAKIEELKRKEEKKAALEIEAQQRLKNQAKAKYILNLKDGTKIESELFQACIYYDSYIEQLIEHTALEVAQNAITYSHDYRIGNKIYLRNSVNSIEFVEV